MVESSANPSGLAPARTDNPIAWGSPMLLAALVVALPAFLFGLAALGREWVTPEYSHGPLIPIFAAFLLMRALRDHPVEERARLRWLGLPLVLLGLLFAYVGTQGRIGDVAAYGLIPFIGGLIVLALGFPRARHGILPTLMLIFMLPLPQLIYWKLTIFLQGISSQIGVWVIEKAGIPVFLDGNVIDLGVYKLQVAEACSGLQYMIPVMSLGLMLAILYRGPFWHRALLVLAAAPVTVALNSLRIGLVGISVDAYGIEAAEGVLHAFEGWVILLSCVAVLVGLLMLLRLTLPRERRPAPIFDLNPSGFGPVLARARSIPASTPLAIAVALTAALSVALLVLPKPGDAVPSRAPFALFPTEFAGRTALVRPLDPDIAEVLGADDHLDATFIASDGSPAINFFASYYRDQSDGSGLHSPEICLPANGWEVAQFDTHTLDMPDTPYGTFQVNRAIIEKGLQKQLVYYWFEGRGKRETNDITAKITVMLDALRTGRTDGSLVRFVTPIEGDDIAGAEVRLTEFVAVTLPQLPDFVPL